MDRLEPERAGQVDGVEAAEVVLFGALTSAPYHGGSQFDARESFPVAIELFDSLAMPPIARQPLAPKAGECGTCLRVGDDGGATTSASCT